MSCAVQRLLLITSPARLRAALGSTLRTLYVCSPACRGVHYHDYQSHLMTFVSCSAQCTCSKACPAWRRGTDLPPGCPGHDLMARYIAF